MHREKKLIYQDSHKPAFNPRTVTRDDLIMHELCRFREEIAKQMKAILQDLFNQFNELQGIESREKRMIIYRDIRDHTKLYQDLVETIEITAEKNEIRKADRSADRLLTDRGYLALPGCLTAFVHMLGRIIAKFSIPMDDEQKKEFRQQIVEAFDESFHIFLLNLAVEDEERGIFNKSAFEPRSQNLEGNQIAPT